jgi:hypothetical protein
MIGLFVFHLNKGRRPIVPIYLYSTYVIIIFFEAYHMMRCAMVFTPLVVYG